MSIDATSAIPAAGPSTAAAMQQPVPRRRWRIAWLLGLGVLINYFDRVNLSVSHASLVAAFGVTDVVFGYLSSAYNLTYAFLQLPIGVLLDKFGVRRIGRIGTFLWSVATFSAAVTPTLGGLFGARFLLGVGEAPTFPANAKAVGAWFAPQERGFAASIFDAAAKFSSVIGVPLIGFVLIAAGWRWSFAFTGVISVAYFFLFWRVYREPGEDPGLTRAEKEYIAGHAPVGNTPLMGGERPSPLLALLAQRKVIGLALGFGAYNYVFYLLLTWLPSYFSEALHIDLFRSFLYAGVPWIVATVAELSTGWLVDSLVRKGRNASLVRRVVLTGGTAFGLGILGAAHAHNTVQALTWISISIGGLAAAAPVAWSAPSFITAHSNVGKVGGIINFSAQLSGIAAPIITGYVVQTQHSYAWAFAIPALYLGAGLAGYVLLLGPIERPSAA